MLLVRERRGTQLDQWIADVHSTGPPELRGFRLKQGFAKSALQILAGEAPGEGFAVWMERVNRTGL
jgi:hypothetical protein